MTLTTPVSAPEPRHVELLVAPGFVATELATALDCLRIANRLSGQDLFRWRIISTGGGPTTRALGDLEIVTEPIGTGNRLPNLLVVVGGSGTVAAKRVILPRVQRVRLKGGIVLVLSDASATLLQAGAATRAAVHWENQLLLAENGASGLATNGLFLRSGNLFSCAGMVSTCDAVLALVAQLVSGLLATDVARVLLLDRLRQGDVEQPKELSDVAGWTSESLRRALQVMEERIEEPLATSQIAQTVGLSTRQLERIFVRYLKMSPLVYYRRMRLQRARVLIESSHLSLTEIAVAVGFDSLSAFSRIFKKCFGQSPVQLRRDLAERACSQAPAIEGFHRSLLAEARLTGITQL